MITFVLVSVIYGSFLQHRVDRASLYMCVFRHLPIKFSASAVTVILPMKLVLENCRR